MVLGTIYLTKTHLMLRDVDGSEVSLTLEDALEIYHYVNDHMQRLKHKDKPTGKSNTSADRPDQRDDVETN